MERAELLHPEHRGIRMGRAAELLHPSLLTPRCGPTAGHHWTSRPPCSCGRLELPGVTWGTPVGTEGPRSCPRQGRLCLSPGCSSVSCDDRCLRWHRSEGHTWLGNSRCPLEDLGVSCKSQSSLMRDIIQGNSRVREERHCSVEGKPPVSAVVCIGNSTAKGSQPTLQKTRCHGKALLGNT